LAHSPVLCLRSCLTRTHLTCRRHGARRQPGWQAAGGQPRFSRQARPAL